MHGRNIQVIKIMKNARVSCHVTLRTRAHPPVTGGFPSLQKTCNTGFHVLSDVGQNNSWTNSSLDGDLTCHDAHDVMWLHFNVDGLVQVLSHWSYCSFALRHRCNFRRRPRDLRLRRGSPATLLHQWTHEWLLSVRGRENSQLFRHRSSETQVRTLQLSKYRYI